MKWLRPYRLAAYVLAIFCAGHTVGGMLAQKPISPAADSVFALMKSTHFIFNGSDGTWYGFWLAFGLTASVFLALSAIVAWQLDGARDWSQVRVIAWALFGAHAVNAVLTWRYFFPGAGTFATLAALLLGIGAWRRSEADSLATK